jgi:hypothetical protein
MNRAFPLLRFLPVTGGLLKWPLKDVNIKFPFLVCRKEGF